MYKLLIFIFTFLLPMHCYSQDRAENIFIKTDSVSRTVNYNHDLNRLVFDLTKTSKNQLQKARAIFVWITHNINYDYKLFNKKKRLKHFRCNDSGNCDRKLADWNAKSIQKTLRKKKAICSGYSDLFKKMCEIAGIECMTIDGYIKNNPSQIGRMGILDHAWNAIVIDNQYYYLDATWASGYCTLDEDGRPDSFVRHYNDYYWLTPIDKLSRNHFPKDTMQLVNSKYNKQLFKKNPYIEGSILPNIDIISPDSGVLNPKIGDTIRFAFKFTGNIDKLQINTNISRNPEVWEIVNGIKVIDERALSKQKYISSKKEDGLYHFDYIVNNKSLRFIVILFDYQMALKYLVKIEN